MDKITQLKNAINFAKQNPNSSQAIALRRRIESGMYNAEIEQIKKEKNVTYSEPTERTTMEKIAGFTGGEKIAQGLGQALANSEISRNLEQAQSRNIDIQGELIKRIREKKARGEDTSRLESALQDIGGTIKDIGEGTGKLLNQKEITGKQIAGDVLQLGTTVLGAGQIPGVAKTATKAITTGKGIIQGAKTGAVAGGIYGTSSGLSEALKEDKDLGGIVKDTVVGGVLGGVTGGILGGATGGVSGAIKGRQLRNKILEGQVSLGEKASVDLTKLNPTQQKAVSMAKTQGFDDNDIKFMLSMKGEDKTIAQKMVNLAEKASVDKRAIERPIDIVGDNMVNRVKFIQTQNSKAGKLVDTTAKALKGQKVDATPIREKALSLLEDAGVYANPDGTPNWSKSIFNKTPELKNKIMKTLSDLPVGEIDAYDLHNFKKSIDEVVNYGIKGEGLKGKSANILKAVRNSADEVLDTTFADYNKANTDFKNTREVLEQVNDLFGKKVGISKERGGQLLRSVFSNNAQRPRVMQLVEQLDKVSEQYGKKFNDNLLDQTLFTEILEDVYGTQATTSLQGQVSRAVKGTQKVIEGLRNPIKGTGEVLATIAEKTSGITPENKKKILNAFLK